MRAGSRVPFPPGTPGAPRGLLCVPCAFESWGCGTAGPSAGTRATRLSPPLSALTRRSALESCHLRLSFLSEHGALETRSGCSFLFPRVRPPRRSADASPAGAAAHGLQPSHPSVATDLSLTLTSLAIPSLPSPLRGLPGSRAGFHVDGSPYSLGPGLTRATAGPSCEWMFPFLGQTRCFPKCLYVVHPTSCV